MAVTYKIFLKAYFSMVIEDTELHSEIRSFLKDPTKSYIETLESIHADYRVQTIGRGIRRVLGGSLTMTISCRGAIENSTNKSQYAVEKDWKYTLFLENVEKLVPTKYYLQFKE